MTLPPKTDTDHTLRLGKPQQGFDLPRHSVACSCGWHGGRHTKAAAIAAHTEHVQQSRQRD